MNPETQEIEPTDELEKMYEFDAIIENLKVLARATPLDKEILIRGLKFRNKLVAVTGDGISDVKCLQTANVGLAMGSGCSVAKEAADIIITDDDFEANIQAVMWGRNIFLNIQRFLQFQVTVNFSCLLTVLIGGMMIGESPFSAVQLLWINLIMDTFAAIALSTEPPIKSVTAGEPFRAEAKLMTPAIWR
jgi:P-type E1-E2 ATPase